MAQLYEIVVYTQALPTYADPILDRLDPSRFIVYRLYRDSTLYQHGHHVRDLSKLNRDMRKVLFITSDAEACKLQPSNSVVVSAFTRAATPARDLCNCVLMSPISSQSNEAYNR